MSRTKIVFFLFGLLSTYLLVGQKSDGHLNASNLKRLKPFDEEFQLARATTPHGFPWIELEMKHAARITSFFIFKDDNYVVVLSSGVSRDLHKGPGQLRGGFIIDLWSLKNDRYMGRCQVDNYESFKVREYYDDFTINDEAIYFNERSNCILISSYKGEKNKKK
jgi:hypothetical protein